MGHQRHILGRSRPGFNRMKRVNPAIHTDKNDDGSFVNSPMENALLGCLIYAPFSPRIFDHDEFPGLEVAERGRPPPCFENHPDLFLGDWIGFESPDGPPVPNGFHQIAHKRLLSKGCDHSIVKLQGEVNLLYSIRKTHRA